MAADDDGRRGGGCGSWRRGVCSTNTKTGLYQRAMPYPPKIRPILRRPRWSLINADSSFGGASHLFLLFANCLPCYRPAVSLTDLRGRFRDDAQRRRTQRVIEKRLADDRNQDECRYLMRFVWQLHMTYCEVTEQNLQEHVGADKLRAIEVLVEAARRSPESIDAWIDSIEQIFPVVHDRGYETFG
ncbi:hypothetical protein [Nocardia sp. NBC_00403]|uniref:hypothetical protein n=1 Tax=Nocardia sp. NBC_00403 TaxID=2975990 RepID=UPI002E1B3993